MKRQGRSTQPTQYTRLQRLSDEVHKLARLVSGECVPDAERAASLLAARYDSERTAARVSEAVAGERRIMIAQAVESIKLAERLALNGDSQAVFKAVEDLLKRVEQRDREC